MGWNASAPRLVRSSGRRASEYLPLLSGQWLILKNNHWIPNDWIGAVLVIVLHNESNSIARRHLKARNRVVGRLVVISRDFGPSGRWPYLSRISKNLHETRAFVARTRVLSNGTGCADYAREPEKGTYVKDRTWRKAASRFFLFGLALTLPTALRSHLYPTPILCNFHH